VLLVISLEQLRKNRGTVLEYGGQLSAALTRMLLCESAITPVVLGENSEPLYVGRAKRCVTPAQRKALIARDGGCAKPGRGRRPHHCQAHHIIHWAQGGATDISNMLLLFTVVIAPDPRTSSTDPAIRLR
jgi:5-methylcytosine-specific restriction protein A